jgi:hypothetical protein
LTFGKYKGSLIEDVPVDYLAWVLKDVKDAPPWLLDAIKEHLGAHGRSKAPPPPPPPPPPPRNPPPPPPPPGTIAKAELDSKVKQWFRSVAMDYHPDRRRGSSEAMTALNDAHDRLRKTLAI